MDYRPYILAGTFLLFVIAVYVFARALARSKRPVDVRPFAPPAEVGLVSEDRPIDTDLEGLTVEVGSGAPSAALLTPLRTGDWMPPEEPAPAEKLPELALEQRIEGFQPEPDVPEPSFTTQAYASWEVGPEADAPVAPDPQPTEPEWAATVPLVVASTEVDPAEEDDEFGAQIRALLPEEPAPFVEPVRLDQPLEETVSVLSVEEFEPSPPAVEEFEPAPPFELPMEAPEIPTAPVPMQPVGELQAPAVSALEPERLAAPAIVSAVEEPEPVAVPVVPPVPVDRPVVSVSTATPPVLEAPPADVTPAPARVRPGVRVHGVPTASVDSEQPVSHTVLTPSTPVDVERAAAPEIVMAAPVEMWFGDTRVGVKAGTATYERFRKYADVLFDDLKAGRSTSR